MAARTRFTASTQDAYIVSGVRTPIGRFGRCFVATPAVELGSIAARSCLARAGVSPEDVDEVLTGQVLQAGAGQNAAR